MPATNPQPSAAKSVKANSNCSTVATKPPTNYRPTMIECINCSISPLAVQHPSE
jgi:hypothetical protein